MNVTAEISGQAPCARTISSAPRPFWIVITVAPGNRPASCDAAASRSVAFVARIPRSNSSSRSASAVAARVAVNSLFPETLSPRSQDPASPYYAMGQRILKMVGAQVAKSKADPNAVARSIVHAATVRRPRLRYLVGKDAHGQAIGKALLPFSVIETAVERYLKK